MADIGGRKLTQNTGSQSAKAEALMNLVEEVVKKIEEIDEEITSLVRGGMEGTSVQTMANTYISNREVINDYVKRFAATACVLDEDARAMNNINQQSGTAAGGTA